MDKAILLQKQVRDNSEDLQKEFREMQNWEEQMKKKDLEIQSSNSNQDLPPIRTKKKKKIPHSSEVTSDEKPTKAKRIAAYDYKSWDKFDVEKACSEVDESNEKEKPNEKEKQEDKENRNEKEKLVHEVPSKEELEKEHEKANVLKEEGNALVQKREYAKAIGKYSEAIKIFSGDAVYFANRALCQLKINNLYSAESDCSQAIILNENYVKAYHRRATVRIEMKRYNDAKKDLEAVLRLEPTNKEAKCMLTEATKKIEKSQPLILAGDEKVKASPMEKKIAEKLFGRTEKKKNATLVESSVKNEKKGMIVEEISGSTSTSIKMDSDQREKTSSFKQVIQHDIKKVDDLKLKPKIDEQDDSSDELPAWLPKLKKDVTIVEPLTEAPQKCNKKLTRVPVTELPGNESIFQDVVQQIKRTQKSLPKEKNISQVQAKIIEPIIKTSSKNELSETKSLPPPPKSSVAFLLVWRDNSSLEFRYKYLKQIVPKNLPDIFKESMESNIFSDILTVLNTKFVQNDDKIYEFLHYLSLVKRFRALILFISQADKNALKNLFEHCKTKEEKSDEEIHSLQAAYEM